MAFDTLIGNEALRARLAADLDEGKLSHAYIIEGAFGSGKKTLAMALCAAIACNEREKGVPCMQCVPCRKVLEGKCPDVIHITRDGKASIGVDEVRFLRGDVHTPPNDLTKKIYIIEQAELLTEQAQNALLLTLEEPPPYVLFLLLCENATALLETIRSRAPRLRMQLIESEALERHLMAHDAAFAQLPPKERAQVLLLSDGSVGRARLLCDAKERAPLLGRKETAAEMVDALLGRTAMTARLTLVNALSAKKEGAGKREELSAILGEAMAAMRDLLLLKRADAAALTFYADRDQAQLLCDAASAQSLLSVYERLDRARRQLQRNANIRLVLTSLLLG